MPVVSAPRPPAAHAFKDWRDATQTPGDWRYEPRAAGGVARFGSGAGTVFMLVCDRQSRTVSLVRSSGASMAALPMSIATTSEIRALIAEPAAGGQPQLIGTVRAQDTLLDAMTFSRGRFAVEVTGLPTLYVPAWAEVGRVVEDCRSR